MTAPPNLYDRPVIGGENANSSKTTVLIVEDEAIVAADLASKLTHLGYEISGTLTSGEEAVTLAQRLRPNLVLMDIRLTGAMDGVEAAERIRRNCGLPVIYITAHSDRETLQRAKLTEPFGYILKPFLDRELETHIQMALYKHQAEEKLRQSEERYRMLFERNPDGVFTVDPTGAFQVANPACETIFGVPVAELLEKRLGDVCAPDQLPAITEQFQRVWRESGTLQLETAFLRRDGTRVEVWIAGELIRTDGRPVALHCTARDITVRKRAETDQLISGKLESTGLLAGGIAHDFNNLLTAIFLNLDLASTPSAGGEELTDCLKEARNAVWLARGLTQQLLIFAEGGAPVRKPTALAAVLQESARLALRGGRVRGEFALAEDLWLAEVDEGQIGQVFWNLLLNAREAMPEGGAVVIRAENVVLGVPGEVPLPMGDYIKVSITDQGEGIPPELLPKIFDPYFSTKQRGTQKGMGLGLTICHAVVQKHGGAIAVRSEAGVRGGATFCIYLPGVRESSTKETLSPQELAPRTGKILVMDDEEGVRTAVTLWLRRAGYEVEATVNGDKAIDAFERAKKAGRPFDVAILDLTVRGGMGGQEAMRALLKIDPTVKAIVMSGYANDSVVSEPQRHGFQDALLKPFDSGRLQAMLAQLLGRGG